MNSNETDNQNIPDTWEDPIVTEVRQIKEAHAESFGFDLNAIIDYYVDRQEKLKKEGRKFIESSLDIPVKIIDVRFHKSKLIVLFSDGREIKTPLSQFPKLEKASVEQRNTWVLTARGRTIFWGEIGEKLKISTLLRD